MIIRYFILIIINYIFVKLLSKLILSKNTEFAKHKKINIELFIRVESSIWHHHPIVCFYSDRKINIDIRVIIR